LDWIGLDWIGLDWCIEYGNLCKSTAELFVRLYTLFSLSFIITASRPIFADTNNAHGPFEVSALATLQYRRQGRTRRVNQKCHAIFESAAFGEAKKWISEQ